ncbi:MAG: DNA-processing protein DprA [Desulfurivibrionaceae bacterium]|nr:DNA-processing protein DprA [Desulfurivibrionaceae bacterium]
MTPLRDWLSLTLIPGLGNVLMARLLAVYGEPAAVLEASARDLYQVPGIGKKLVQGIDAPALRRAADRELQKADQEQVTILTFNDPRYPELLRHIYSPPLLLYVQGDVELLATTCVAMVGSRAATVYGKRIAADMAQRLAASDVTVVSGVALGIDAAAHAGALAGGKTIGVLGCGLDVVYPRQHRQLYQEIAGQGALVSEYPFGTIPEAFRFPSRNRIISGVSQGVVVVEAAHQSGSLITARLALEQGRDVFAIPGRIDSMKSCGVHRLLQEGATLVQSVDDIFQELGLRGEPEAREDRPDKKRSGTALTPEEERLYGWLDVYPQNIDELIQNSHMAPDKVAELLLLLELKGLIESLSGNHYQKISSAQII